MLADAAPAFADDAAERGFMRERVAKGEGVLSIGKPDHETFTRNIKGEPEEKAWSYFPHSRDPQILTTITP